MRRGAGANARVATAHPLFKITLVASLWMTLSSFFELNRWKRDGYINLNVIPSDIDSTAILPTVIVNKDPSANEAGHGDNYLNDNIQKGYDYISNLFGFKTEDVLIVKDMLKDASTVQPTEEATNTATNNAALEKALNEGVGEDRPATAVPTLMTTIADTEEFTHPEKEKMKADVDLFDVERLKFHEDFFHTCTTPEKSVSWPFYGQNKMSTQSSSAASSMLNPELQCGFGLGESEFLEYFQGEVKEEIIQPILNREKCTDLVVFGAAFGSTYVNFMKKMYRQKGDGQIVRFQPLVKKHGRCFFMFVNPRDAKRGSKENPRQVGHYYLIPLDPSKMPYKNARRNAKFLKYVGNMLFLNDDSSKNQIENDPISPKVIIWQDAKFFRDGSGFPLSIPRDYSTVLGKQENGVYNHLPCMTTMSLPVSSASYKDPVYTKLSVGLAVSAYNRPKYIDHCRTIIDALKKRPGVTDNPDSLIGQCVNHMAYVLAHQHHAQNDDEETDQLNYGMIDSAFIIWNESTRRCRDFNAMLRCSMFDQLQCHSDRDQVLFPLLVHRLLEPNNPSREKNLSDKYALRATYFNSYTEKKSYIDKHWAPHAHDLDLVHKNAVLPLKGQEQVYIRIQRSGCHWYFYADQPNQPMGERSCGHKIWIKDNLALKTPSLSQEQQIAVWASPDRHRNIEFSDEDTPESLAKGRGLNDVIEAPFAADFLKCTSNEYGKVPYTFRGASANGPELFSCGTNKANVSPVHRKLSDAVAPMVEKVANKKMCSDLVVFGIAFETGYLRVLATLLEDGYNEKYSKRSQQMVSNHGNCFFLFASENDVEAYKKEKSKNIPKDEVVSIAHYWVIPVPLEIMPYQNIRRNMKFIQYSGQFFFPDAKKIVYQDIVMFAPQFINRQPVDYHKLYNPATRSSEYSEHEPCVTLYSLPENKATIGATNIERGEDLFPGHCKHIINSIEKLTPDGQKLGQSKDPATTASLIQQCDAYIQFVYKREIEMDFLNQVMADTNFVSWNEGTQFCRDFNADLRCTILDQLHCHSDRDRLAFAFALYVNQMGHGSTTEFLRKNSNREPVDERFRKSRHDLQLYRNVETPLKDGTIATQKRDVVKILRSGFHWTRKAMGARTVKKPRKKKTSNKR